MTALLIILGIIVVLAVFVIGIYNRLVALRQTTNQAWSDIEVQLKQRQDLVPQLVNTVKGYASHEKKLFVDITEKRNQALAAGNNPKTRGAAESALGQPVGRLLAVAEDYPDLKASQNFLDLQNELSDTEDKIEMARRFYNGAVRTLNIKVKTVPSNIVAKLLGFYEREFFEIDGADAAVPNVEFKS